jgi:hypothetical protein
MTQNPERETRSHNCEVCAAPLSLTLEMLTRGGRPRRYCPSPKPCKRRADRRHRTIAQLQRWRDWAWARGNVRLIDDLNRRLEALRQQPFSQLTHGAITSAAEPAAKGSA